MHPVHCRFLLASLILAPALAEAQSHGAAAGPFVGANLSSFGGGDASGSSSRAGPAIGLLAQVPVAQRLFFQAGALYSMWGADISGATLKIDYIQVPALLGYRFPGQAVAAYLTGGPVVGFKLSCNVSGGGLSMSCASIGGDIAGFDYGVALGAGLALRAKRNRVLIDLRYLIGVHRVESTSDLKNLGFTLGVGYLLPLGRQASVSHS